MVGNAEMEDQRATPKHYSNATTSHPGKGTEGKEPIDCARQAAARARAAVRDLRMTGCNLT